MASETSAASAVPEATPAPTSGAGGAVTTAASAASAVATEEPKSFVRRDRLVEIAARWQSRWAAEGTYCKDAPAAGARGSPAGKFLVTFPYPYMNGRLHLGHAFSMTKAEFAARFQRLLGKDVLFPFAFHCTGMPIQAAANRLRRELEPEDESGEGAKAAAAAVAAAATSAAEAMPEVTGPKTVFKSAKSKVKAKGGDAVSQADILRKSGVPDVEIAKFADPVHWLRYFPPIGQSDLESFGLSVDWRRSFITTDVNPFYDSFIRWQFRTLREQGRIDFGKRPTIYSPRDGQACADHDRASGEGVGPQEYTLIKLRVATDAAGDVPPVLRDIATRADGSKRAIYLVAATLRPETMYGQTNCFVLPDGEYGAFEVNEESGDVFVCSERAAINLSYQSMSPAWGETRCLKTLRGTELLGLPLNAPYATYPVVYCLPLLTISMGKGTGVVTSVPSDAPDDFAALRDLKRKPALREKYGITADMVEPFEVVEIIEIPEFGRRSAETACDQLKIQSQNDTEKLVQAKELVYTKGFYSGVMLVGSQAGKRVEEAKPLVRAEMIAAGLALPYFEPEKVVISRSGDECVVAFIDQWYLRYGEEEWRSVVESWVKGGRFTAYNSLAQSQYESVLSWLKEWACSRSFGLGTHLPWDEQFVIESLSDSTIYMAYYTVAALLQGPDNMDGTKPGPLGIRPDQLSDGVWDYIFLEKPYPADCSIPEATLERLRSEFLYWYPMDLRVSGKDLIQNHLTMALYNHAAIWSGRADRMPQSFYTNGHVLVDGLKMSKSLGNFLTLRETVERYGPDAMRLALASAGDGLEDANFERHAADSAVLRLYIEEGNYRDFLEQTASGKLRTGEPTSFMDCFFAARMSRLVNQARAEFEGMRFREAVRLAFFEIQIARDEYKDGCVKMGEPMNAKLLRQFMEVQTIVLAPICPHWCEEMWELLGHPGDVKSVTTASWPTLPDADPRILATGQWLMNTIHEIRATLDEEVKKLRKREKTDDIPPFDVAIVYCSDSYKPYQVVCLDYLASKFSDATPETPFPDDIIKGLQGALKACGDEEVVKQMKNAMAFAAQMVRDVTTMGGRAALASKPAFSDAEVLRSNMAFIQTAAGIKELRVLDVAEVYEEHRPKAQRVVPGQPVIVAARASAAAAAASAAATPTA